MSLTLVVLAAGIGSRWGGLKQMYPVGPSGEFVLDYGVYDARNAGFDKVVFVVNHGMQKDFDRIVGGRLKEQIVSEDVFQNLGEIPSSAPAPAARAKPLGTGHALWCCRNVIDGPFAVINADDFYGRQSYETVASFLRGTTGSSEYGMVGFVLRDTLSGHGAVARGICHVGEDGLLADIVETRDIQMSGDEIRSASRVFTGEELVSMNLWALQPSIFERLERELVLFLEKFGQKPHAEFFLPSVIDKMIAGGEATVKVLGTESAWFGLTYRKDHVQVTKKLRKLIEDGHYPGDLWAKS